MGRQKVYWGGGIWKKGTGSWLETGKHYLFANGIFKTIPDDTPKVYEQLPESVYEHFRNHYTNDSGIGVRRTPDLPPPLKRLPLD